MKLVWDLDGTLIQTKEANRQAYLSLGVKPPPDFHVRPWQSWCSPEVHQAKGSIILGFIRNFAKPTELYEVWMKNGKGTILTNASVPVIAALRECYPGLEDGDIRGGMTADDKVAWLSIQSDPGVYFDDAAATIAKVRERTIWTAILV